MKEIELSNDLQEILTQALERMKEEDGDRFSLDTVNLSKLGRLTNISRSKLRRLKKNGFKVKPHGNKGKKAKITKLTGFTGVIDDFLRNRVTNSEVILRRLSELGYTGKVTIIKDYIAQHQFLIPAERQAVSSQGNRGRRYTSEPGEQYQMDWGFVTIIDEKGDEWRAACFAMICHHCGTCYIEFFTNARQENLFIGMIHAFEYMGVPETVLTDNMKSVTLGRDPEGQPIWQKDYEVFMKLIGFRTKLCKPRHPFTKGAVERLIRFVKDNFVAGRTISTITSLNIEAFNWCEEQNGKYHRAVDCVPADEHEKECRKKAYELVKTYEVRQYLCPERSISFDGFINYEGRRFGVPYAYTSKKCRVMRDGFYLYIYDSDLKTVLTTHNVTWSRKDSYCPNQYTAAQPEEYPSVPVKATMKQREEEIPAIGFSKFDFGKKVKWDA